MCFECNGSHIIGLPIFLVATRRDEAPRWGGIQIPIKPENGRR
jgi:hypothetical protein